MSISLSYTLIAAALIAATGGILGAFALLRRMALVGDALSHVALPGLGLGLLLHFSPPLGGLAFLVVGTCVIWVIEHRTALPVDTLVGVLFTLALAVGALITPELDLLEALFGDITKLTMTDFWIAVIASVAIFAFLLWISRKVVLAMISPDLARSIGINAPQLEFIFLLLFAFTVAVGIQLTGALLMGSLVIIPAATARNISRSLSQYMWLSALFGVVSATAGVLISHLYGYAPGPSFVLIAGVLFFVSVIFRR